MRTRTAKRFLRDAASCQGSYLDHHLESEDTSEDVVEIPQHLQREATGALQLLLSKLCPPRHPATAAWLRGRYRVCLLVPKDESHTLIPKSSWQPQPQPVQARGNHSPCKWLGNDAASQDHVPHTSACSSISSGQATLQLTRYPGLSPGSKLYMWGKLQATPTTHNRK